MNALEAKIDRLQTASAITMKRLGPEALVEIKLGLTGPQYYILRFLAKKGKTMVSEIAAVMNVKPSAITVMIERMHRHAFVERLRDDHDRRVVFIEITEKGRDILQQMDLKRKQVLSRYLKQLGDEELDAFVQTFEKLATIVMEKK